MVCQCDGKCVEWESFNDENDTQNGKYDGCIFQLLGVHKNGTDTRTRHLFINQSLPSIIGYGHWTLAGKW